MEVKILGSGLLAIAILTKAINGYVYNVSLKWSEKSNVLCLKCFVQNMGFGAYFFDPNGKVRGHCNSPILAINRTGHCDYGMKQLILPGHKVENVLEITLVNCENGRWKCVHGRGRKEEDTADVTMDVYVNNCPIKMYSYGQRCYCVSTPILIGYLAGLFLFTICRPCCQNATAHSVTWRETEIGEGKCWIYSVKGLGGVIAIITLVLCFASIEDICKTDSAWFTIIGGLLVAVIQIYLIYLKDKVVKVCLEDRSDEGNTGDECQGLQSGFL